LLSNGHGVIRTTKGNPFGILIWLDVFLRIVECQVCWVFVGVRGFRA